MKSLSANYLLALLFSIFGITSVSAQNKEGKDQLIIIEQRGDSLYCSEKNISFEDLNFEFDSCNFYNNKLLVTFQLQNNTKQNITLYSHYISWYDSSYFRNTTGSQLILKPTESGTIKLETIPYHKRKMFSRGELTIICGNSQELKIPMQHKFETSKVKKCVNLEMGGPSASE